MDIHEKLKRSFFITFALLMGLGAHYFQHNQGGSGLEIAQNNIVWIFFSILIGLGLWKITLAQKIVYSKMTIVFLVACILFFIPLFYPNNALATESYTRLMGLFAGFLLFVSLQQMRFNTVYLQRLLFMIVLAGFLQACYSLTQDYLLPPDNIFGYQVSYGRPYGIFQQSNVLASFMATTLILAGYLLQKTACKKIQFFLLLTALLNTWVIVITISRVGYLGSVISLVLLIPWAWKHNRQKLFIFIIAILVGIGCGALKEDMLEIKSGHMENITQDNKRVTSYSHSLSMIMQQPLLGYGYGSFEKEYLNSYAPRVKNGEVHANYGGYGHPHNETLLWTIEGGVLPLLAILLLVIGFLRLLKGLTLTQACALTALVVPIALHTQTEYPLYQSALHWLVLIVLISYIDSQQDSTEEKTFTATFALRAFALLIPMLTLLFMLSNLHTLSKITTYERSKKPDIMVLMGIINPIVFQHKLDYHLTFFRTVLAQQNNNQQELQKTIIWVEKQLQSVSKPYYYVLLHLAYQYTNQAEKAQQLLKHARYLHPRNIHLKNIERQAISQAKKTENKILSSTKEIGLK